MDEQEKPLSVVLFSGTDDKLNAAAVLTVGAAAMGRPVHLFLQYYALDAFRAGRVQVDHALSPEATSAQAPPSGRTPARTGASCFSRRRRSARSTSRPARCRWTCST